VTIDGATGVSGTDYLWDDLGDGTGVLQLLAVVVDAEIVLGALLPDSERVWKAGKRSVVWQGPKRVTVWKA
jgi:hypothetical protein